MDNRSYPAWCYATNKYGHMDINSKLQSLIDNLVYRPYDNSLYIEATKEEDSKTMYVEFGNYLDNDRTFSNSIALKDHEYINFELMVNIVNWYTLADHTSEEEEQSKCAKLINYILLHYSGEKDKQKELAREVLKTGYKVFIEIMGDPYPPFYN